jgi:hypothetical protein
LGNERLLLGRDRENDEEGEAKSIVSQEVGEKVDLFDKRM